MIVDRPNLTVSIEDDGVGMTRDEAVENLGTIAKSGTRTFLDQVKAVGAEAPKLIGQFGLGFYSAFMVAEQVAVESCSALPGEAPVRWSSGGAGTYSVEDGTRLKRGTLVTLKLRADAEEFADPNRLRSVIRKHSNYLPWPITVDGQQANAAKAVWLEPPSQVSDEEANAF